MQATVRKGLVNNYIQNARETFTGCNTLSPTKYSDNLMHVQDLVKMIDREWCFLVCNINVYAPAEAIECARDYIYIN